MSIHRSRTAQLLTRLPQSLLVTGWWTVALAIALFPARSWAHEKATTTRLANLDSNETSESSGVAVSQVSPEIIWTHNDSGSESYLYAFDLRGKLIGRSPLKNAECRDWEDMGSFTLQGQHFLFVADTGDNNRKHHTYTIYWGIEPDVPGQAITMNALRFRYEDGPHDCEAVAFDPARREFLLVEKKIGINSRVYRLPWNPLADASQLEVATRIGSIPVVMATGADITSDGQRLIVATYGDAFELVRSPEEEWHRALRKPGQNVTLPLRRQGESICYAADNMSLYLTSEDRPCPLFSITRPISDNNKEE